MSTKPPTSPLNLPTYLHRIHEYWNHDRDKSTFLYYMCLLAHHAKDSTSPLRTSLANMVTLESERFDTVVKEFKADRIIDSEDICRLDMSRGCFDTVVNIIRRDMGNFPPPFDGVKLHEAKAEKRYSEWVKSASNKLRELFNEKTVTGLNPPLYQENPEEHRVFLDLSFAESTFSPLTFMFLRDRLSRDNPISYLLKHTEKIRREGDREVIGIIAAPSTVHSVAEKTRMGDLPTLRLGPINLARIVHYLEQNSNYRTEHFKALLSYLDVHKGLQGGIIFAPELIEFFKVSQQ